MTVALFPLARAGALLVALLVFASFVAGTQAQAASLAGTYDCTGTNPDGSSYEGTAIIEEHAGLYSVEWRISGAISFGVGKVSGDLLIVNWGDLSPVIYKIDDGGQVLRGTWRNGRATDNLTRR